ncbi:unnamed protein product [Effrenium voratum]|uniref:Uncharacterized protein n=1 Tax=Effrenium voratum TaxID=2562239 RepID=A0AA36JSB4_9DINO|nr:unnamed protein product [Effrenium voratum]
MVWGADKPFLTKLAIRRWQARFPFWPPPDASPVTPIEPWGKQFFAARQFDSFGQLHNVDVHGLRGMWFIIYPGNPRPE